MYKFTELLTYVKKLVVYKTYLSVVLTLFYTFNTNVCFMNSNQKFSRLFLLSFIILFSFNFTAQSSIITGIVVDENKETMPGVNVKVFSKDGGTTTDFDGKYVISVDSDSVKLIFSFVGYRNFTTDLNGRNKIDVQLQLSTKSLDEVV